MTASVPPPGAWTLGLALAISGCGGGWSAARPLAEVGTTGPPGLTTLPRPVLAMTGRGRALVASDERTDQTVGVRAIAFDPEKGWRFAVHLDAGTVPLALAPKVGTDDEGNGIALWVESDDRSERLMSRRLRVPTGWDAAQVLATAASTPPLLPGISADVAMNGGGEFLVAWRAAGHVVVRGGRRDTWNPPQELGAADPSLLVSNVQVALNAEGDGLVTWVRSTTGDVHSAGSLFASTVSRDGGWTPPVLLAAGNGLDVSNPVVDPRGDAVLVLRLSTSPDPFYSDYSARRFSERTGWQGAQKIGSGIAGSEGRRLPGRMALDDFGNGWFVAPGAYFHGSSLKVQRFRSDSGWEPHELDQGDIGYADVDVTPAGTARAVWTNFEDFWTSRNLTGRDWEPPERLVGARTGRCTDKGSRFAASAYHPRVGLDDDGNALLVWAHWDCHQWSIWYRRYVTGTNPATETHPPPPGS
jgi:hypothetical protein